MSSIDALRRKLDRMIERVDARPAPGSYDVYQGIDFTLFTEPERQELQGLLAAIAPRIVVQSSGFPDLSQIPEQELDPLRLWMYLYDALARREEKDIARYRYLLTHSLESLIAAFKAIDIDQYSENELPGYPLSRVGYRDLLWNAVERGRAQHRCDDLYLWIEYDQARGARSLG